MDHLKKKKKSLLAFQGFRIHIPLIQSRLFTSGVIINSTHHSVLCLRLQPISVLQSYLDFGEDRSQIYMRKKKKHNVMDFIFALRWERFEMLKAWVDFGYPFLNSLELCWLHNPACVKALDHQFPLTLAGNALINNLAERIWWII